MNVGRRVRSTIIHWHLSLSRRQAEHPFVGRSEVMGRQRLTNSFCNRDAAEAGQAVTDNTSQMDVPRSPLSCDLHFEMWRCCPACLSAGQRQKRRGIISSEVWSGSVHQDRFVLPTRLDDLAFELGCREQRFLPWASP